MKKRIAFILLCVIFAFTAVFFSACDEGKDKNPSGGGSNTQQGGGSNGGSEGVHMPVIPI